MKNRIKNAPSEGVPSGKGVPLGKPQRPQRNTLSTLKEYPFKEITEKIISCVPRPWESSFFTWTKSIRKFK